MTHVGQPGRSRVFPTEIGLTIDHEFASGFRARNARHVHDVKARGLGRVNGDLAQNELLGEALRAYGDLCPFCS